jgi:hypothetical protein
VEKPRILHIFGIDDSDTVTIRHLSPDITKLFYNFNGNVAMLPLLDEAEFEVHRLVVGGMAGDQVFVPPVKVVLNAICDADANKNALTVAEDVIDRLRVPVVNHPKAVRRTARDEVSATLAGDPDLDVPKTVRIRPSGPAEVRSMIEAGELTTPFLMRETGVHGGVGLTLVEGADLPPLDHFAFDGREFYVTDFVDFRSADGRYRKYRVFVIDGVALAKHLVVWTTWNVHLENRELMSEVRHQEEERAFLEGFSNERYPVFGRIARQLGLDFFGVDFGLDPNGRVILFEANACFRALRGGEKESRVGYHEESVTALRQAFTQLVRSRIASGERPRSGASRRWG